MRVRSPNNLYFGLFLLVFAVLGLWLVRDLRLGTSVRMGPGYMPTALCWVLVGLGALTVIRGFVIDGDRSDRWFFRGLFFVSAGVGAFALTVERLGLVLAVAVLVLISSLADSQTRRFEIVPLAAGLGLFCAAVFIKGLGLPMEIWPVGLR